MGNLAIEIFSGPTLAGGLRVTAYESPTGIFPKPLMCDFTLFLDRRRYRRHQLQKFGGVLKTAPRIFLEERLNEDNGRLWDTLQLFKR